MAEASVATRAAHVVVVGAGVGGLVTAALLAQQGVQVTVVEAADGPGGKMRQVQVAGAAMDAGPTVFTLRWVFEQIFAQAGVRLADCLELVPLSVLARHHWPDGATLDLYADAARSTDAIAAFAGAGEAQRFVTFCNTARKLYQTLEAPYIRSARPSFWQMVGDLGPRGLMQLAGLGPFATLWQALGRQFADPRLRQLFGRYATYCGASPWSAPATLMLVAQVEMAGVWAVRGGMHAVAQALAALAQRCGATLHYGQRCEQITLREGRADGVRLQGGEHLSADAVVFNGDVGALAQGMLGHLVRQAVQSSPVRQRSLSAVTWNLHAATGGLPLVHHNVFFDDDYATEFSDIFIARRLPRRPTVYLCAQDRDDAAALPAVSALPDVPPRLNAKGQSERPPQERLLCLVNAPPTGDVVAGQPGYLDEQEIDVCERNAFALIQRCGLTIDRTAHQTIRTTPREFERLFPGTGGALYGQATHGWMALFRRHASASRLPGLYLTGGSVHPGPGVPMAAMSGQLAAATIMARLHSTSRSRRVVISGGMSMPSATTASTG